MASGSVPPSTSKSKSEKSPGDGVKSYDFLADTKWWLHPQLTDSSTFWEPSWETINIEEYANIRELEAAINDDSQKMPQVSENPEKIFSEMDPRLTGINKTEPWWRTADSNILTSIVSDKHINNFDPPWPQINIPRERFESDKGLASLEQVSKLTDSIPRSPTSIGMGGSQSPRGLDNPLSNATSNEVDNLQELSQAQLLEALCHSQTRAREAEKAAQQAYNEKEHLLTHFFKQASHLFAYKQWLHILQLETTCLHLRNSKYQLVYSRFPDFVPWVPTKENQPKSVRHKAAKAKPDSPRYKIGTSFRRFVLGLTLVGAGLLLGWTLGWLFR
ncbi:hypothetical protein CTI12_AA152080 [Artemisia annua]|uniref:Uncharacterized protein n=1 Tax=Artemisia annua TaxID=35608 RepID=A0A2U1PH35_ARTAN|nr:hypothetical protein CTI12_AA152080 [Artemisia annua]